MTHDDVSSSSSSSLVLTDRWTERRRHVERKRKCITLHLKHISNVCEEEPDTLAGKQTALEAFERIFLFYLRARKGPFFLWNSFVQLYLAEASRGAYGEWGRLLRFRHWGVLYEITFNPMFRVKGMSVFSLEVHGLTLVV